jgi:hypothetical protein
MTAPTTAPTTILIGGDTGITGTPIGADTGITGNAAEAVIHEKGIANQEALIQVRFHIEHAFRRYFSFVFPLLIVAAGIETALIPGLQ